MNINENKTQAPKRWTSNDDRLYENEMMVADFYRAGGHPDRNEERVKRAALCLNTLEGLGDEDLSEGVVSVKKLREFIAAKEAEYAPVPRNHNTLQGHHLLMGKRDVLKELEGFIQNIDLNAVTSDLGGQDANTN